MDLSVIVVSYNTKALLKDCLKSVENQTRGISFEVFVVDNASTDGSVEMVKRLFPKVKVLENRENLGFAAGNNRALHESSGRFLLLLNSDTKLIENSLEKMVSFMEKNKKIGISSCQLINPDGLIQASGGFFPNFFRIFTWMFFLDDLPFVSSLIKPFHPHTPSFYLAKTSFVYLKQKWFEEDHSQDWVTGAFFLMRKEVFKKIGELDEKFFMYAEEMEFCYRAKKAGFEVNYTPRTKIIHLGGGSGGSENAIFGEFMGLKYFFNKHYPRWQGPLLRLLLKLGALIRLLIFGIMGEAALSKRKAYEKVLKQI